MIPLRDDIHSSTRPFVTYAILGLNIIVYVARNEFILGTKAFNAFITQYGAIPYLVFHPVGISSYLRIISSMFMHAGLMHIAGNMLFLWVFSDNVEDRIGHVKYLFFYLVCGIAGTLLFCVTAPSSEIPLVGASGAISGVLGAYILLYPKAKVLALIPLGFFMRATYMPSYLFLGLWFGYQLLLGFLSGAAGGGVAYFAHIGGFVAGLLLALPFRFMGRKSNIEFRVS